MQTSRPLPELFRWLVMWTMKKVQVATPPLLLVIKCAEDILLGSSAGVRHAARVATTWARHVTHGTWAQSSSMIDHVIQFALMVCSKWETQSPELFLGEYHSTTSL